MKNIIAALILALGTLHADGLFNPSVRRCEQLGTVDIYAKGFYWYASETLDWAFTLNHTANTVNSDYRSLVFDWAPGFSVGFGFNIDHDQWDVRTSYTWFNAKASDHTTGPVTSAFLGARTSLIELIQLFSAGKGKLNLLYNMFDIDLGRGYFLSDCLSIRPSIGIKGGWITQKIRTSWTIDNFILTGSPLNATENLNQRFQGGGPKGGITGKWYLSPNFSLMSQFEAGYLWGHWSINDTFIDNLNTIIFVKTTDRNYGALVFHSFLGFGWDSNFNCDQSHIALQIGYEIEDWFNHLQIFTNTSGSQNNDLILQGFNCSLNLDF
ncbi:MAG: hypothetical protein K1X28_02510 [Parachlamydiales bacterium]|nr:hypothetical protein [Parachlamydiales bacterium]